MKQYIRWIWQTKCIGRVLRKEAGYVLRKALGFEVEDQKKKWRLKKTCKSRLRKKGLMFA